MKPEVKLAATRLENVAAACELVTTSVTLAGTDMRDHATDIRLLIAEATATAGLREDLSRASAYIRKHEESDAGFKRLADRELVIIANMPVWEKDIHETLSDAVQRTLNKFATDLAARDALIGKCLSVVKEVVGDSAIWLGVPRHVALLERARALLTSTPADEPVPVLDREALGRLVREIWIEWAKEQPSPKPSWLAPWEQLSEPDKEVDRRIGERLARVHVVEAPGFYGRLASKMKGERDALLAQLETRDGEYIRGAKLLADNANTWKERAEAAEARLERQSKELTLCENRAREEIGAARAEREAVEALLKHIATTYCGVTVGADGITLEMVPSLVDGQIEKQEARANAAEEAFKNLTHLVHSRHEPAQRAGACAAEIRRLNEELGPLGPLNEFETMRCIVHLVAQPYEVENEALRQQLAREGKMRDQAVNDMLTYKRRSEAAEGKIHAASLGEDAYAVIDAWKQRGAGFKDPSLGDLQARLQLFIEARLRSTTQAADAVIDEWDQTGTVKIGNIQHLRHAVRTGDTASKSTVRAVDTSKKQLIKAPLPHGMQDTPEIRERLAKWSTSDVGWAQMSGRLLRVGTMQVSSEEVTGYFVESTKEQIRALPVIPMLEPVQLVPFEATATALLQQAQHHVSELRRIATLPTDQLASPDQCAAVAFAMDSLAAAATVQTEKTAEERLAHWLSEEEIEKTKEALNDGVTGEILYIATILRVMAEDTSTSADDLTADGAALRAEDAEARAADYLHAYRALVDIFNGEPTFNLIAHLHRQRSFSERTFGPGERTAANLAHIRKELLEIEANPRDLTEWIDVVLLSFDGAWRHGGTPESICSALRAKQTKNEARTWPDWRTVPAGEAICHVEPPPAG